jgi:Cof subfamily protein (haloacid dehalogenase superfamily)
MIKAAFFDIDRTLLSHATNSVPASAKYALEELRRRGVLVFVATGRDITVLRQMKPLQDIAFDGAITLNGQYCFDRNGIIYANPIPRGDIAALLSHLEKHPIPCGFIEAERMYMNFHNERVQRVHEAIHSPPPALGDLRRGYENDVFQILLYLTDEELAALPPLPHVTTTKWHDGGIDMIPLGGGKAVGIRKVLEHYGISPEETIAFGDGANDIDMFHAVKIAVAMGNAADSIKEEADFVTTAVDDDGIYNALKHFDLI